MIRILEGRDHQEHVDKDKWEDGGLVHVVDPYLSLTIGSRL